MFDQEIQDKLCVFIETKETDAEGHTMAVAVATRGHDPAAKVATHVRHLRAHGTLCKRNDGGRSKLEGKRQHNGRPATGQPIRGGGRGENRSA